ncbi:MAG: putative transporter permease protein [Actinomycetia bacterium]|nr:putative transporter permease protein [Actinomycetes bacterium]
MNFLGQVWDWFLNGDHWTGKEGIPNLTRQHIEMTVSALLVAALLAIPIGLWLGHRQRGGFVAINVSNFGRALPSYALLLFGVTYFGIGNPPTFLTTIGVNSIPVFIALVLLGIPPILTNTFVGMSGVDADLRESARGMGMTGPQSLRKVELPVAMPLIMAGIRTAAVAIVATATLAALVDAGGLGRLIVDGQGEFDKPRLFAGALCVAVLALIVEYGLAAVQRVVVPKGLREETATNSEIDGVLDASMVPDTQLTTTTPTGGKAP